MKHGLPVNIDAKSKILLYEWFEDNNITGKNIHVVKADLHTENYNNCDKFDYRNVLSLFGASDYSSNNFSRNPVGCSFDMLVNNKVLRGVFTVN